MNSFKWRKGLLALIGLGVIAGVTKAWAAPTDSVAVYVRVSNLSVNILEATLDFSAQALDQSVVAASALNVGNDGNVTERFALKGSLSGGWTLSDSNGGVSNAVFYALFRQDAEGAPAASLFTTFTDTISVNDKAVPNGAADGSFYSDPSGDGQNVLSGSLRDLWLMVLTPETDGTSGAYQTLYLTITALAQ